MNIGILAHVDAGKTTITEQMLHICGVINEVGRVDNGNATTDGMALERARGITIRQSTVTMHYKDTKINLLDTPGHVDFIAEVERSLSVLDAAVLAISAKEGVQTQTKVIFNALKKMKIPTIIMVNKVDRMGVDLDVAMSEIRNELTESLYLINYVNGEGTRDASLRAINSDEYIENTEVVALIDETTFESITSHEKVEKTRLDETAQAYFRVGEICPVLFGSALLGVGVSELIELMVEWVSPFTHNKLSAVVYKVDRDSSGYRRCFTRVFGGTLVLRETYPILDDDNIFKILKMDALHGIKPFRCDVANAGDVIILYTDQLNVGSVIGELPSLRKVIRIATPTLKAKVQADDLGMRRAICDALTQLTDEDPFLGFEINKETEAIELKIFGIVQKEIIEQLLFERFGIETKIMKPEIIYKARPLKSGKACRYMYKDGKHLHATVGLIIEPLALGEGLVYETEVSFGDLKKPFQNAVKDGCLKGLQNGINGLEVTDVKIRFVYSEFNSVDSTPSDYRKLSEEVVALALENCGTGLLEPIFKFELWVPHLLVGKAIADVLRMRGQFDDPIIKGEMAILKGIMPQETSQYYEVELADYSSGKGVITFYPYGYSPVKNEDESPMR